MPTYLLAEKISCWQLLLARKNLLLWVIWGLLAGQISCSVEHEKGFITSRSGIHFLYADFTTAFASVRKWWGIWSGPSCSKLTTLLVNNSLKFTPSDMQVCWNFLLKKMWVAFAMQKLLTFFQQKISEYCILNLLKQLTKWPLMSLLS